MRMQDGNRRLLLMLPPLAETATPATPDNPATTATTTATTNDVTTRNERLLSLRLLLPGRNDMIKASKPTKMVGDK